MPPEIVIKVPIRKLRLVVDTEDTLAPELTLEDFRKVFGKDPDVQRYRVLSVEVITSPEDQQPMLVSECGHFRTFLRREADAVYFKQPI